MQKAVVTFEKKLLPPLGSAYRIEVFRDGQVLYTGLEHVKTTGQVRFQVPERTARQLVDELRKLGLMDLPDEYRSDAAGWSRVIVARVTLIDQGQRKVVTFGAFGGGADIYDRIAEVIERHVPTHSLRCPFVLPETNRYRGTDVCTLKKAEREGGETTK